MKTRSFVLVCSLGVLVTALASGADVVENKYDDGKVKQKYSVDAGGKKDGPFTEYYPTGKVKIKATYKAGELEGAFTEYFDNGKVKVLALYKAGKLTGLYTENNERGVKQLTANYKGGKLNGNLTHYYRGFPVFALPFKDGEPVYSRTQEQIKKKLADILDAPVKGEGLDADRLEALKRLKAYRYLCEVPYDKLTLDDQYNKVCQAGAALNEKIGRLDHTPKNPGLPEADYQVAYEGTSKSNLGVGYANLSGSVDAWMDDSDKSNIDRVGHRRWCINPPMGQTGFGKSGKFSAMYSHDQSNRLVGDFDFIAYPTKGWMPVEFFGASHAWNVSFHPAKYRLVPGEVKTQVTELDAKGSKVGEPLPLNYNAVNTGGFGLANCVIFRPDHFQLTAGKRYLVEIDGLIRPDGRTPAPVRYVVDFFSLK